MWQLSEPAPSGIESWDWNLKGDKSTYHALYPRSWTIYDGNLYLFILSVLFIVIIIVEDNLISGKPIN